MTGDQVRAACARVRQLRWWRFPWSARIEFSAVLDAAADTIDRQQAELFRLRAELSVESKRRHTAEIALDEVVRNEREDELNQRAEVLMRELAIRQAGIARLRPRQRIGKVL